MIDHSGCLHGKFIPFHIMIRSGFDLVPVVLSELNVRVLDLYVYTRRTYSPYTKSYGTLDLKALFKSASGLTNVICFGVQGQGQGDV